jgi:hypothetical protein
VESRRIDYIGRALGGIRESIDDAVGIDLRPFDGAGVQFRGHCDDPLALQTRDRFLHLRVDTRESPRLLLFQRGRNDGSGKSVNVGAGHGNPRGHFAFDQSVHLFVQRWSTVGRKVVGYLGCTLEKLAEPTEFISQCGNTKRDKSLPKERDESQ